MEGSGDVRGGGRWYGHVSFWRMNWGSVNRIGVLVVSTGSNELIWRWCFSYSMMYPWLTACIIREYVYQRDSNRTRGSQN